MIETFATDEHRIGLKPVIRRIWAPKGQRPTAIGHHRFEWLYVTAFVSPATGESFWYLTNGVSKRLFEAMLVLFAKEVGAGLKRRIILVLDNAGWHSASNLTVPDGIRLVYLPPYTPELQPAETLWVHVDEPIVNRYFETLEQLDTVVARQCVALQADRERIRGQTGFHWWPDRIKPTCFGKLLLVHPRMQIKLPLAQMFFNHGRQTLPIAVGWPKKQRHSLPTGDRACLTNGPHLPNWAMQQLLPRGFSEGISFPVCEMSLTSTLHGSEPEPSSMMQGVVSSAKAGVGTSGIITKTDAIMPAATNSRISLPLMGRGDRVVVIPWKAYSSCPTVGPPPSQSSPPQKS